MIWVVKTYKIADIKKKTMFLILNILIYNKGDHSCSKLKVAH